MIEVYPWCMGRTNIEIDDDLIAEAMRRYGLATKREAVDFALRRDRVRVEGSLRRRFFRTPAGAASRYEVEVRRLVRDRR